MIKFVSKCGKLHFANATHGIDQSYHSSKMFFEITPYNIDESIAVLNNLVSAGNPSWNTTETGTNGTEWTLINLNYWSC